MFFCAINDFLIPTGGFKYSGSNLTQTKSAI